MNWGVRPSDMATGWRVAGGDHCGRPEPSPVLCQAQPRRGELAYVSRSRSCTGKRVQRISWRLAHTRPIDTRIHTQGTPCTSRQVRTTHRRHRRRRPSGSWQRPAPTAGPFKLEVNGRPQWAAHVQLDVLVPAAGRLRAARSKGQTRAKWPPASPNAPRKRGATGCVLISWVVLVRVPLGGHTPDPRSPGGGGRSPRPRESLGVTGLGWGGLV